MHASGQVGLRCLLHELLSQMLLLLLLLQGCLWLGKQRERCSLTGPSASCIHAESVGQLYLANRCTV